MSKLYFILNQKQFDALNGLIFPELDNLQVPFWVQNTAVNIGENINQYRSNYFIDLLKDKNIFMEV